LAVLQIQLSHYFTTDTFIGFFTVNNHLFRGAGNGRKNGRGKRRRHKSQQIARSTSQWMNSKLAKNNRLRWKQTTRIPVRSWLQAVYCFFYASIVLVQPVFRPCPRLARFLLKLMLRRLALALPLAMLIRYSSLTPRQRSRETAPLFLYLCIACLDQPA